MRGVYTAQIDISSLSSQKTLLLIQAPSTGVVEIISCSITNLTSETSEMLTVGLYHVTTIGTVDGTSVTPEKHEKLDAAASSTVLGNLSDEPTTYSSFPVDKQGINNLSGYRYDPLPEERPIIPPSGAMGLRMLAAPSSFDASVQIVFREIG